MKEKSIIGSIGILLYILMSTIDRFYFKLPDYIYIIVGILSIILIIIGFIIDKKNNVN